jgi:hypothetical protein
MKKAMVESLKLKVGEVARQFSNPERTNNMQRELYKVSQIIPLSENVAVGIFDKSPSGKKALATFIYINGGLEGYWMYFFPTYDQISGLTRVADLLQELEVFNFDKN